MHASLDHIQAPDLEAIANKEDSSKTRAEACKLISLVLCVAVQSDSVGSISVGEERVDY